MEYVEENRIEHVISWVLQGRGFVVHDPDGLVELLPLFFSQTKYRSFRRQLNMWHFERIEKGPSKGAFIHPYFVRGNRELCYSMSRHILLKPQRGSSIGSNGSSSCSSQSEIKTEQEQSLKIQGENSEILRRGNYCSSSRASAAAPRQQHLLLEAVPSMHVQSLLSSSCDGTFTLTKRSTTFDAPDPDSFAKSRGIDLPFVIEPDPIRAVVVDWAAQKNATKSISGFSKVPSYHQLDPSMTVANFLKDALFSETVTNAICWDDDLDFLSLSEQDDRVRMSNCYGHDDQRVVPSFVMPRSQSHHGGKTILAAQHSSSLVTNAFKTQHRKHPACLAPQQILDGDLGCEGVVHFLDLPITSDADVAVNQKSWRDFDMSAESI